MAERISNIKLTDEQVAQEELLSCMIERQSSNPCATNRETLFNALKNSDVYLPAKIILDDEIKAMLQKGIKPTGELLNAHSKCVPELIQNKKTGEKAMCVYSRETEMGERVNDPNYSFIRLPFTSFLRMAENIPEAFEIILDFMTHPVICTLDQLLFGVFGEGEDPEGQETEADD